MALLKRLRTAPVDIQEKAFLWGAIALLCLAGCDPQQPTSPVVPPPVEAPSCAIGNGGCSADASCAESAGAIACECPPGFEGDGTRCADVDECSTGNGGCASTATCTNTPGGRTCACVAPAEGDGLSCIIDHVSVAVGETHACAVRANGQLLCWGGNEHSQIGDGTGSQQPRPKLISSPESFQNVVAGLHHTCALRDDGTLWCWGLNTLGQLGHEGVAGQLPGQVGSETWLEVSAGNDFTCGIRADRSLWCWGSNEYGQLGTGVPGGTFFEPQGVDPSREWKQVRAGHLHACALDESDALFCWGDNAFGKVFPGGSAQVPAPVEVTPGVRWREAGPGRSHTCAVRSEGTLWCWGSRSHGVRPGDTGASGPEQTQVGQDADWAAVRSASYFACGRKQDGRVLCWGENNRGALGHDDEGAEVSGPREVEGRFEQIALRSRTGCGLRVDGSVSCWGDNLFLQLGIGDHFAPKPRLVSHGTWRNPWSFGLLHCALQNDRLYCTGENQMEGGVGDGTRSRRSVFVEVGNGNWLEASVGGSHGCGLQRDGTIHCWGSGSTHANGTVADQLVPLQVGTESDWVQLQVGGGHSCAVKANGTLWCWGDNRSGELGIGAGPLQVVTPTQVGTSSEWERVQAGNNSTCGIRKDRSLWCWGYKVPDGEGIRRYEPVQVGAGQSWAQMSAGIFHSCARTVAGRLYCWGDDSEGAAGTYGTRWVPTAVGGSLRFTEVSAGFGHTCAVATDGALYCWGTNAAGALGIPGIADGANAPTRVGLDKDWVHVVASPMFSCGTRIDGSLWCWGQNASGQHGNGLAFSTSPVHVD